MQGEGGSARETISEPQLFAAKSALSIGVGHFQGGLLTPLQHFSEVGLGFADEVVGGRRGYPECGGDLDLGVAVGKQQEGGLLPGGEGLESSFEVELGEELLFLLIGQTFPDLKLGRAERLGSLLDLFEIEKAKAFATAHRRIPRRDPSRLAPRTNKNGGPNPNGFEPPLLRPSRLPGPTSLRSFGYELIRRN